MKWLLKYFFLVEPLIDSVLRIKILIKPLSCVNLQLLSWKRFLQCTLFIKKYTGSWLNRFREHTVHDGLVFWYYIKWTCATQVRISHFIKPYRRSRAFVNWKSVRFYETDYISLPSFFFFIPFQQTNEQTKCNSI